MIKLVSVNIEEDLHHATVVPFLQNEHPDVVCLQEIFEEDLLIYEKALGMKSYFIPTCYIESFMKADGIDKKLGVAILTKENHPSNHEYIYGDSTTIPVFEFNNSESIRNNNSIVLLWVDMKDENGESYTIATTHFTWTYHGLSTDFQKNDAKKLISILDEKLKNFILVGDLNAPRGNETFSMLASKYIDNIPLEYDSSLDPKLHRVKNLKNMVDGLFSTPPYVVSDVKLIEGVSDHKAIISTIKK